MVLVAAIAIALPAFNFSSVKGKRHHLSAVLCDWWTIISSIAVVVAWSLCRLHFHVPISKGDCDAIIMAEIDSSGIMETTCSNEHASIEEVSNAIVQHSGVTYFILGTASVLEFLQLIARRLIADDQNSTPSNSSSSIYTLFNRNDSECLLFVYLLLVLTHFVMSLDRGGEVFGLLFAEPIAAIEGGYYRPISTARYIEWSIASPILMSLVGRSIPRLSLPNTEQSNVDEVMRPALLMTVSYIFLAWVALLIVEPTWRWGLIFVSYIGWILSAINQLTSWRINADPTAPCAAAAEIAMKIQIVVFGLYGVIYLLPLFEWIDAITEQAVMAYADATAKIIFSVGFCAMRQADAFAMVQRERRKADSLASDLFQTIQNANAPIFRLDAAGNISLWNDKLVQLTGATLQDIVNKPLLNYLSEECRAEFLEIFNARKRGVKGSEQFHCDMIVQSGRNEGSLVTLIMTATARHNSEGRFVGIIGVGSDLTEITRIKAVEETKNQFMAVSFGHLSFVIPWQCSFCIKMLDVFSLRLSHMN